MADGQSDRHPEVWILDRVSSGHRQLDVLLRESAIRVWPRARALACKDVAGTPLRGETGVVMSVWEGTLQHVSERLKTDQLLESIRDLDSYVLASFANGLKSVLAKETAVEFVPWEPELEERPEGQDWSWIEDLQTQAEVKEAVELMDDWMKSVAHSWAVDELDWSEISKQMGGSTNAVKKRFYYYLDRIRRRMAGNTTGVRTKR
jgi:hypothetical protein